MLQTEFPRQPLFENLDHVLMGLKGNFQHGGFGKTKPVGLLSFVYSFINALYFEQIGARSTKVPSVMCRHSITSRLADLKRVPSQRD